MSIFSVQSISVGTVQVPGPELYWMSDWDQWFDLEFQIVLLRAPGINILVNTGPPPDLSPINSKWMASLGERGEFKRSPEQEVPNALARAGVSPDMITHVVITPFQLYTTGNITLFPNAEICMSKRGWIHYHTSHQHPHDSRWHCIDQRTLVHLVTEGWPRVRLLEDEDVVVPGVRTWFAGTHHRASLAIDVDTKNGVVCISDAFFTYQNVEDGRVLGINENMYEALATYDRARSTSDVRLPLYDPEVFRRFPGGVLA
jgi:hypothetical protein